MSIASRTEIREILEMPRDEFRMIVKKVAKALHRGIGGEAITETALFGYFTINIEFVRGKEEIFC